MCSLAIATAVVRDSLLVPSLLTYSPLDNRLTGGLEALQLCPDLRMLHAHDNRLTGGLEPLRSCTALNELFLSNNHLVASEEDKAHFEEQCELSCI